MEDNKKKIVFFIQNFSRPAGSERVASIIANTLCASGYDVTVLSICGDNTCFYPLNRHVRLVTLIDRKQVNNKKDFFKVRKALKKFYENNHVDLVIDIFAALSIYTLSFKKKYHFKNITWEHFNFRANIGFNQFGRKLAAKKSNVIVTLTEKDRNYYIDAFPNMKAHIENIFNPSPYENIDPKSCIRENLLISVGRLTYQKGFDVMLNIWSKIESSFPDWKLQIIGSGEEEISLQKIIEEKQLERAELLPPTKNIAEYYRKAKIYLSTSRFEGLPMTMLEAQSFGVPIVSYDYDTGPSDIISDQVDGLLIENENEEQMTDRLTQLMRNSSEIKQYSDQAFESSKRFALKTIINRWLDLINDTL